MNTNVIFSSKTDLWETPQKFFDEMDAEFHFNLDVCALPENAKCTAYYTPEMNGRASMRLIDADELSKVRPFRIVGGPIGDYTEGFVDCAEEARSAIKNAPTIDAVPVVRCRECKHGKRGVDNMVRCFHPCGKVISMTAGDFCSYGQRKESDHEVSES